MSLHLQKLRQKKKKKNRKMNLLFPNLPLLSRRRRSTGKKTHPHPNLNPP